MLKRAALVALLGLLIVGQAGKFIAQQEPEVASRDAPIKIGETVEPAEIFVKGSGDLPQIATVTLKLESLPEARLPLDAIIIVDRSATVNIKEMARIGAALLDALIAPEDRVGLVSFATDARVDVELTSDIAEVKRMLGRLRALGKTAVGEGLAAATDELINKRREEATAVEILLTDGRSNAGRDPVLEAQRAAENGVKIFPIGVGRAVNKAILSEIARVTGGIFFEAFNPRVVQQISRLREQVGREIQIIKTLPKGINFEGAVTRLPRVGANPDGSTTLEWDLEQLTPGESWTASFQISAGAPGEFKINQEPSTVSFIDARGNRVTQPIPTQTLRVIGQPIADFTFSPLEPRVQDPIEFTDQSRDTNPTGSIVAWNWDFGDKTKSTKQNPTHTYTKPGDYTVMLTVTDNDRLSASVSKTITVLREKVAATRTIDTFLPTDYTVAGETFRVTVTFNIDREVNGLGLDEDVPAGWEVTTVENAGAVFRKEDLQWVFVEAIPAGETLTIIYDVKVKDDQAPGIFRLRGIFTSAMPEFSRTVGGENQVEIKASLPIRVVMANWDVEKEALNLQLPDKISFDQIQIAVAWWVEGKEVPKSGGKKIDFKTIQELIAYWLTDTSVFEPLPK